MGMSLEQDKPIPQDMIDERWESAGGKYRHCKIHGTYFVPSEEPCWQCYNEVQEIDNG